LRFVVEPLEQLLCAHLFFSSEVLNRVVDGVDEVIQTADPLLQCLAVLV